MPVPSAAANVAVGIGLGFLPSSTLDAPYVASGRGQIRVFWRFDSLAVLTCRLQGGAAYRLQGFEDKNLGSSLGLLGQ